MNKEKIVTSYIIKSAPFTFIRKNPQHEIWLQRILFLSQSLFLVTTKDGTLLEEEFLLWKGGPILCSVHFRLENSDEHYSNYEELSYEEKKVIDTVLTCFKIHVQSTSYFDLPKNSHKLLPSWLEGREYSDITISFPISKETMRMNFPATELEFYILDNYLPPPEYKMACKFPVCALNKQDTSRKILEDFTNDSY